LVFSAERVRHGEVGWHFGQSGVNPKVAQTLAGHHSTSFTLDQYADAIPQQLEEAGEKVAGILLEATGSKTVAPPLKTVASDIRVQPKSLIENDVLSDT
jgi:hypothetical protein